MMDMIATAFQSDTTRISTFMFGNAVSNVSFRFLEGVALGITTCRIIRRTQTSCGNISSSTAGTSSNTPIC